MKFYRTSELVRLYDGVIFLSEKQISGRKKNLDVGPKGKCKIKAEVQFKAGEVIGLENVPKILREILAPVEEKRLDLKG